MATRLLRIWRTSKARFCGSALRGAWKGEKGVPAVDRGGAGGGVVIVVSVDTVEARERAERSQLDFIALAFMRSALRAVLLFCSVCIRSIPGRLESRSLSPRISELYKQELRVSKHEIQWHLGYRQLPYLFFFFFPPISCFLEFIFRIEIEIRIRIGRCHHFSRGALGLRPS